MTQDSNSAPDYAGHSGAHTPGPWSYKKDGAQYVGKGAYSQRYAIPEIKAKLYGNEANARLIAAAPELLAACREASAMLEHLGVIGSLPDQLNAAISKAEGRRS